VSFHLMAVRVPAVLVPTDRQTDALSVTDKMAAGTLHDRHLLSAPLRK
jgi:hypothetical protein